MSETGESSASIYDRIDQQALPSVLDALRAGATLFRPSGIKNFYTECRDDRDPNHGRGISAKLVKKLEQQGVLSRCGVDRYALGEEPIPTAAPLPVESQMKLF